VRRHGIGWIVFPYRLRPDLLAGLSRHPSWRLVYVDSLAVVFVREDLGAAALVHESARRAVRPPDGPADLDALPGLGGVDRAGSGSGWLAGPFRRRSYPFASFNRGIFHFHRREPVRAATAFAEAVRRSEGAYYEIYGNLGAALLATDRLEPARECYRIYLRELPFYRVGPRRRARARLDEIDRRLGD
jgi:hypothetical protein